MLYLEYPTLRSPRNPELLPRRRLREPTVHRLHQVDGSEQINGLIMLIGLTQMAPFEEAA